MADNGKKKKNQQAESPLPLVTIAIMGVLTALIAASGWYFYNGWVVKSQQQNLIGLSEEYATQYAVAANQYISGIQNRLNNYARRETLSSAAQSEDLAIAAMVKKALLSSYPDALSQRLLSLDRKERISEDQRPLSFIEMDMINQAEQQLPLFAEPVMVENEWRLIVVAPITTSESETAGTLLLELPIDRFRSAMRSQAADLGEIRILRKTTRKDRLIFSEGSAASGPLASMAKSSSQVGESEWRLEFTPSSTLIADTAVSPLPVIGLHLLAAALLLPLGYWLGRRFEPARKATGTIVTPKTTTGITVSSQSNEGQAVAAPQDILDIELDHDDEGLFGESSSPTIDHGMAVEEITSTIDLPEHVFRSYDIRGEFNEEITPELARHVGLALGSEALAAGDNAIYVARDGRTSSPELCEYLIQGIVTTGCNAINLGAVPTPLLYFAVNELGESASGVVVTGSHNPANCNGFKMIIGGITLLDDRITDIRNRIRNQDYQTGHGQESEAAAIPAYIDRIFSDVALAGNIKLVIDAGNGITGTVAPMLFEELGCEVVPLYCEVDGQFPNHDPDPTAEGNLQALIDTVAEYDADLGVAFDGDGDRLILVTPSGEIIQPDRLLMLFAKDIVSRNPGTDVVFDVKCTRELNSLVSSYGGRPIMWKSGHSNMKSKMMETGALVGGELSGHIFIKDRWYGFDDGMYACARLLEIMTMRDQDIDALFESFPVLPSTPEIIIPVDEGNKFAMVQKLITNGDFGDGKINTLDGIRVEYAKGWGLVRASNTSAALTLRFETETADLLPKLQALFKRELLKADDSLTIPF